MRSTPSIPGFGIGPQLISEKSLICPFVFVQSNTNDNSSLVIKEDSSTDLNPVEKGTEIRKKTSKEMKHENKKLDLVSNLDSIKNPQYQ